MNKDNTQRDKELFFLIKKDDLSAFKALFKKYYNNLCHFSNNIIKDRLLAEEAVSDVYEHLVKYDGSNYEFIKQEIKIMPMHSV